MLYSILPASVAIYFLIAGIVVQFRFSKHPSHIAFVILCATTFVWQFTWAILFQTDDPALADILIKVGYLLIIFLPTSIYHFLIEITATHSERRLVLYSYGFASILAILLVASDMFVSGHYQYFFGYYPKAGILHPLHVLQTIIVTSRGLYLVYRKQKESSGLFRSQLRYCLISLLIYTFAAVDYLCNYGYEFYPPGIFFITVGLSIFLYALLKKELMTDFHLAFTREHEEKINLLKALAGNIAHELRTPLATIRMEAQSARPHLPVELQDNILTTVHQANVIIDMLLANLRQESINYSEFEKHSARKCVQQALSSYPFQQGERDIVKFDPDRDFIFYGSDSMLVFVIYNLLKNSLYSIARAMKGNIDIWMAPHVMGSELHFRDTGGGIAEDHLPYIFDDFYSSKPNSVGNGLGLGFCTRVMNSFGGSITADSIEGEYCEFVLFFPDTEQR